MSKIILSFDDGRYDNYRVAEDILRPLGINATFNITTGYVDGTLKKEKCPGMMPSMTIDQVKDLYSSDLFEIAGHGDCHLNTFEDWMTGITKLSMWLGSDWLSNGIGIASPNSEIRASDDLCSNLFLRENNVQYVRLGLYNQRSLWQRGISRISAYSGNKWLFVHSRKSSLRCIEKTFCLYAVPVLYYYSLEQVKAVVNYTVTKGKDCILIFHSILKDNESFSEDLFSWPYDRFGLLCNYLHNEAEENRIKIVKTIDAVALNEKGTLIV